MNVTKTQIQLARTVLKERVAELKPVLKFLTKEEKKEINVFRDKLPTLYMYLYENLFVDDASEEILNELKRICKKEDPSASNFEKACKYYELHDCLDANFMVITDMKKEDTVNEPRIVTIVYALMNSK